MVNYMFTINTRIMLILGMVNKKKKRRRREGEDKKKTCNRKINKHKGQ